MQFWCQIYSSISNVLILHSKILLHFNSNYWAMNTFHKVYLLSQAYKISQTVFINFILKDGPTMVCMHYAVLPVFQNNFNSWNILYFDLLQHMLTALDLQHIHMRIPNQQFLNFYIQQCLALWQTDKTALNAFLSSLLDQLIFKYPLKTEVMSKICTFYLLKIVH